MKQSGPDERTIQLHYGVFVVHAVENDGQADRFYDQECTPTMFERGQGPIPWPTHTKLALLLSKFMDGDEMISRTFPGKWLAEFYRKKGLNWSP